jgi:transcription elongation factor Elf1
VKSKRLKKWQKNLYQQLRACPWCGDDRLRPGAIALDGSGGHCVVRCAGCGARWCEVWQLQTIEDISATSVVGIYNQEAES